MPAKPRALQSGSTLVETMVVMVCILIAISGAFYTVLYINFTARRVADYSAAMAIVQAKTEEIRAASYNPPNYPFGASNIWITNVESVSLSRNGTNLLVPGTVISLIQPIAQGHLVTVTGTFTSPTTNLDPPFTVSLQTVVNSFSGGQNN
ncbi:MAG TPA: type II secretion system protein [Verrucomicrobiae bacterium]|nr:type II secretion system protein [Verrucomicrobiae bacterium]